MNGNESQPIHLRLVGGKQDASQAQAPELDTGISALEKVSAPLAISRALSAARDAWAGRNAQPSEIALGEEVLASVVFSGIQTDAAGRAADSAPAREVIMPKSVWMSQMFEGLRADAIAQVVRATEAASEGGSPLKMGRATSEMRAAAA